jgi:hypothetical protein
MKLTIIKNIFIKQIFIILSKYENIKKYFTLLMLVYKKIYCSCFFFFHLENNEILVLENYKKSIKYIFQI